MDRDRYFWEAAQQGAEYMAVNALRAGDISAARSFILDANEARDMLQTGAEIEARFA